MSASKAVSKSKALSKADIVAKMLSTFRIWASVLDDGDGNYTHNSHCILLALTESNLEFFGESFMLKLYSYINTDINKYK